MKEATGELNITVIVAISIGILAAFFFGFLWPLLNNNFHRTAQCRNAICNCSEEARQRASTSTGSDYMCECKMRQKQTGEEDDTNNYFGTCDNIFYCPFKG